MTVYVRSCSALPTCEFSICNKIGLMRHHDDWRSDYFQTYIKQARVDMYRASLAKNSLIIK
jgi:hypothetical protein